MKKDTPENLHPKDHIEYLYQILLAIRNVNQLITTEKNRENLLKKIYDIMVENKGYYHCKIIYIDEEGKVEKIYDSNIEHPQKRIVKTQNSYPCYPLLCNNEVTVINNPESTCRGCPLYTQSSGFSTLVMALRHGDRHYGIFSAMVPPEMVEPEELALFKEVVGDIGYALHSLDVEDEREKAITALRQSEQQYRRLLDSGGDGVTVNILGKLVYVNKRFVEMIGYSEDELLGASILDLHAPEYRNSVKERTRRRQEGFSEPSNYDVELIRKDGSKFSVSYSVSRIIFEGKPASLTYIRDISERVRYERKLELLYRHAATLATAESPEEAGQLTLDQMRSVLGFDFASFLVVDGGNLLPVASRGSPLIHERIPLSGRGITARAARTGKPQLIPDVRLDPDFLRGSTDSLSELAVPIKLDSRVVAVLNAESLKQGAFTKEDLTLCELLAGHVASAIYRISSIDALKASENKYRSLFEGVTDAVFIHRLDGRIIEVNKVAESSLGYGRDELLGMSIAQLDSETDKSLFEERLRRLLWMGQLVFEVTHVAKDSTRVETEVNARVIELGGEKVVLSACRNISERKRYINHLSRLHSYAVELSRAVDACEVYRITFREMVETLRYRRCGLLLVEDNLLRDVHLKGYGEDVKWSLSLDGRGITVRAARTGETVYVPDVRLDPDYLEAIDGMDVKSEIAVPVKLHGKVVAVLNVESSEVDAFTEADRRLLDILVNHTTSALTQLEQVGVLRDREKKLISVNKYASDLTRADTVDIVWDTVIDALKAGFNYQWAGVAVISEDHLRYVRFLGVAPLGEFTLPLSGPGVTIRAIHTGEAQLVRDVRKDRDFVTFMTKDGRFPALSELAVPVKIGGKPFAVINIESLRLDAFDENDQRLLEMLANHVGDAVNRIEHINEIMASENRMAVLHEFTKRLAETRTIDEVAGISNDAIKELLNTTRGSLSIVENDSLRFIHVYEGISKKEFRIPLSGRGITIRAARTGETQLVSDATKDPDFFRFSDNEITGAELAVPVKRGKEVVAVINAEKNTVGSFTASDQQLMEVFANHLSLALSRIREEEAKENFRSRLELLHELALQLDSANTVEEAIDTSSNLLKHLFEDDYDNIALVQGGELVLTRPHGKRVSSLPLSGRGLMVKAVRENRLILVGNVEDDPDFVPGEIVALSELVLPLRIQGEVVGVINLESTKKNAYTQEDVKLAETLALHVSSTLSRIRSAEERQRALETAIREEAAAGKIREIAVAKTRFLSTATHEIRTPLASIMGYTELIQNGLQSGDISKLQVYFDAVQRNTKRLSRLTDDLLDTQRLEEGRLKISKIPTPIGELLNDLAQEATPGLTHRHQTLEVSDGFSGMVNVDRDRILQVLANLVGNASKFSPEGSTLWLSIEERGGEVLFSVRDEGVGISAEDMPKLFKPFPEIHVENNREGTGLGLSICRGIVELHDGRIWAESGGLGKGSTFSFTISER